MGLKYVGDERNSESEASGSGEEDRLDGKKPNKRPLSWMAGRRHGKG